VVDAESKAAPEDKGVSSDAIAIILTGLTAVGGYILQAQAAQARESERLQKVVDVLHQQRQVQTQRAQEWLQLAH
jgi:hypothetical protein